jgi:hypothetical protein
MDLSLRSPMVPKALQSHRTKDLSLIRDPDD